MTDLVMLAGRATEASRAGEPLTVTPAEFLALQQMALNWDTQPDDVRLAWEASLRERRSTVVHLKLPDLPVVVKP